jgi:hypothetical protein
LLSVASPVILFIAIYGPPIYTDIYTDRQDELFNMGVHMFTIFLLVFPALILVLFIIISIMIHIRIKSFYPKFYKQEKIKVNFNKINVDIVINS